MKPGTPWLRVWRLLALAAAFFLWGSAPEARAETLKVNEAEAKKAATKKVPATYPPMARQMNLTGRVEVEALVDEAGSVQSASVKMGNPVLGGAALAAIKQWKFTPFTADGKPANAVVTISFDFQK